MKKHLITIATTLSAILIVSTATYAIGTLTPTGTAGDNTQYSLNDIYSKLVDFTDTPSATSSPFTIPESVSASFNTLSEIYGLLEAEEADLVPENIKDGTTIFGVEGTMETGVVYSTDWSLPGIEGDYVANWASAVSYCENLEEGDHTDWRLPTIIEYENAYITTNPGNNKNFWHDNHWSSTSDPSNPGLVFIINMGQSQVQGYDKTFPEVLVRCVR